MVTLLYQQINQKKKVIKELVGLNGNVLYLYSGMYYIDVSTY